MYARINQTISSELLKGFSLSFLLITLTMIWITQPKYGLLSIFPNVFPATIVFGFGVVPRPAQSLPLMLFSISIGWWYIQYTF